jgi:hypothetical protein
MRENALICINFGEVFPESCENNTSKEFIRLQEMRKKSIESTFCCFIDTKFELWCWFICGLVGTHLVVLKHLVFILFYNTSKINHDN